MNCLQNSIFDVGAKLQLPGRGWRPALRLFVTLAVTFLCGACHDRAPRMSPSVSLFTGGTGVVGIATGPLPQAQYYIREPDGLIALVTGDMVASALEHHLESLNMDQFLDLRNILASKLQERGLQVKVLDQTIDPQAFPETNLGHSEKRKFSDHDYSALRASAGIDQLLLLQLSEVGTLRHYYSAVPLGHLTGYARAKGQIISLQDGALMWSATSVRTHEPATGGDDDDFSRVDKAIAAAIRSAGMELSDDLAF